MKKTLIILLALLLIPSVMAINIGVEEKSSDVVMVKGLEQPAAFNFEITNHGTEDTFEFYNLLGFRMTPKKVHFNSGETKNIELMIYPREDLEYSGFYTFKFYIRGEDDSEVAEEITFKIIDLEDAFEVGAEKITPSSNSIDVYIENKVNFNFDNVDMELSSPFFSLDKSLSFEPYEREKFNVQLNKNDFKELLAGFYTLTGDVSVNGENATIDGNIKFSEQDILNKKETSEGFFIYTKTIERNNEGNVVVDSTTEITKNIISRLFTTFSPSPDIVEREGFLVHYTWENSLQPGDTLEISIKTNWLLPLFVILFLVVVIVLAKQYSKTNLSMRKKVSFVKAKGGEFALKVSIVLNAKSYVERVNVIDRLPTLVKLYEKFGVEKPDRVDEKNRRIEWNFEKLESGETRVLSYVVYSKVGVLGRFALPKATAVYEKEGNIHETESNRAFFVTEQRKGENI